MLPGPGKLDPAAFERDLAGLEIAARFHALGAHARAGERDFDRTSPWRGADGQKRQKDRRPCAHLFPP